MNTTFANAAPLSKQSTPAHPVHELIARRWSPYGFAKRPVEDSDLSSLFEAARWAPSSFNEQPWTYIVARQNSPKEFDRLLSCLVPANQEWAKVAPVLVLSVVRLQFSKTNEDNRAAIHDLGLASANLSMEATARDLSVHQMIGIFPERARDLYQIPAHYEAWTAMAIGYQESADKLPAAMRQRDLAPRTRKPVREFVFSGSWGHPAPALV